MKDKKYSGYFCNKCNFIPLIKIIPKKNNIKIFSSCKCHKQYENIESFIKNKYKKDIIDLEQITNESPNNYQNEMNFEKANLDSIIQKFKKEKSQIVEEGVIIKNKLIDIFNKKINEINQMYQKYSDKNNKIILILEQLVQSYELLKDNKSNIINILNNCKLKENKKINYFQKYKDLETLTKDIENYFCNKYIISNLDTSVSFENLKSYYSPNKIKNLIEFNDNICAYCSEMNNKISLIDFKEFQNEIFSFKAHNTNVEYVIKSDKNNIISYGNDNNIKIWQNIDRIFLSKLKENNVNKNEKNKNIYKEKEILFNLNPIIEYNIKINENLVKLIHLKENRFLVVLKNNIFLLFKYSINNIELTQKYEFKNFSDLVDAFIINKENIEIIAINNKSSINFYELPNLNLIKYMNKNSLIQINQNEILINDGYNFKIIELDNFIPKLTIKNEEKKLFLLNLNDGTFIQCVGVEVKRYFIKTMEELTLLIEDDRDDNYDDTLDYNNYNDDIIYYLYKLNDGKIISCYNNGTFVVGYLKFN